MSTLHKTFSKMPIYITKLPFLSLEERISLTKGYQENMTKHTPASIFYTPEKKGKENIEVLTLVSKISIVKPIHHI